MSKVAEYYHHVADTFGAPFESESDFDAAVKLDKQRSQFLKLATRCKDWRDVNRLWNWADNQLYCERFFYLLATVCPWGFWNPNEFNSIKQPK